MWPFGSISAASAGRVLRTGQAARLSNPARTNARRRAAFCRTVRKPARTVRRWVLCAGGSPGMARTATINGRKLTALIVNAHPTPSVATMNPPARAPTIATPAAIEGNSAVSSGRRSSGATIRFSCGHAARSRPRSNRSAAR